MYVIDYYGSERLVIAGEVYPREAVELNETAIQKLNSGEEPRVRVVLDMNVAGPFRLRFIDIEGTVYCQKNNKDGMWSAPAVCADSKELGI